MLLALGLALMSQDLFPTLPVPTKHQLEWHKMGYYAFCHFGPNTFTDKEWGEGKEDPNLFNPIKLDCRQWARAFKKAGMKGIIITAKHHDGFCLWPSKLSTHTVAQSKWKDGKGDVLKELSTACKAEGLKMGVYLSPWDRNHPAYGTPQYNQVFAGMLDEVLTHYGPIFEVWFDGACGEGPNGKRQVYDWDLFIKTVYKHQPQAIIFSDSGPGCRWVGNEDGYAGETNWNMIDRRKLVIGGSDQKYLNVGDEKGPDYVPAECDVSIHPGWFFHPGEQPKSVEKLMDIYYGSVGRGGNLLLNIPPNREGRISDYDVKRLMEFKQARDAALGRRIVIQRYSSVGGDDDYPPSEIGRRFWASRSERQGEIIAHLSSSATSSAICLEEPIHYGQRCKRFEVLGEVNGSWKKLSEGTTIGAHRIIRFPPTAVTAIKIKILDSRDNPMIARLDVYGG